MASISVVRALRRLVRVACLGTALLVVALADPALAQEPGERRLRVGTKPAPPFAMKDEDGKWSGISVELWRSLADELGVTWEFEERQIPGLFAGLSDGSSFSTRSPPAPEAVLPRELGSAPLHLTHAGD
jgi:ABC-type amino acid transport substrate-binding protein